MHINKSGGDVFGPGAPTKTTPPSSATSSSVRSDVGAAYTRSERSFTDQVQISDAARSLASANIDSDVTWELSDLDPARLEQIRARVANGEYLSSDMAETVARAILRRGDL